MDVIKQVIEQLPLLLAGAMLYTDSRQLTLFTSQGIARESDPGLRYWEFPEHNATLKTLRAGIRGFPGPLEIFVEARFEDGRTLVAFQPLDRWSYTAPLIKEDE